MTSVVIDGRMLRHDRAGIGRYIWRLQAALGALAPDDLRLELLIDGRGRLGARPSLRTRRAPIPVRHPLEAWALPRMLRRADLAHFPDHGVPRGVAAPSVVTVHDVSFLTHPQTHAPASRAHYARAVRSLPRAAAVIADSAFVRAALIERRLVPESRVTVVPLASGLAPRAADHANGAARVWPSPYALLVGTVQPRKNVAAAARAFAASRFARQGSLLIAGALGYRGPQIVRAALEASDGGRAVRFLGRVDDAALARLYAQAEFALAPSLDEGFGLQALEAMTAGTPLIAAAAGALPELTGDAALLVDPTPPEAMTAAIDRLADDADLRAALRARARRRASTFSWERTARATAAVYRACR